MYSLGFDNPFYGWIDILENHKLKWSDSSYGHCARLKSMLLFLASLQVCSVRLGANQQHHAIAGKELTFDFREFIAVDGELLLTEHGKRTCFAKFNGSVKIGFIS